MLIRNTLIVGAASLALAVGCFAGVAWIAGPEIIKNGWTIPFNGDETIVIREGGKVIHTARHVGLGGGPAAPLVDRAFAWTGDDTLSVNLPVDVTYIQGSEAKVVISGPQAFVDHMRVEDGKLELDDDTVNRRATLTIDGHGLRVLSDAERVKVTVVAPAVTKFEVEGSGDLSIRRYDQPSFSVSIDGSGRVSAQGKTQTIAIENSGSGYAELGDLKGRDATIDVSGSGGGAVFATGKVKIDISGSGDVELRTEPKSLASEITGSGEVRRDF
jgi:hypothetical protein